MNLLYLSIIICNAKDEIIEEAVKCGFTSFYPDKMQTQERNSPLLK